MTRASSAAASRSRASVPTPARRCPLPPNEFQVGESICSGDSGGPAFAASNAIVGIVSRGGNATQPDPNNPASSCIGAENIYTKVAPFKKFIENGLALVGAEPWYEGGPDPRLAKPDAACTAPQRLPLEPLSRRSVAGERPGVRARLLHRSDGVPRRSDVHDRRLGADLPDARGHRRGEQRERAAQDHHHVAAAARLPRVVTRARRPAPSVWSSQRSVSQRCVVVAPRLERSHACALRERASGSASPSSAQHRAARRRCDVGAVARSIAMS